MPVIPALWRLSQENHKFEIIMIYIGRLFPSKQTRKQQTHSRNPVLERAHTSVHTVKCDLAFKEQAPFYYLCLD